MHEYAERFALQEIGQDDDDDDDVADFTPHHDAAIVVSAWLARKKGIPLADSWLNEDALLNEDINQFTALYNQYYNAHRPHSDAPQNDNWLHQTQAMDLGTFFDG